MEWSIQIISPEYPEYLTPFPVTYSDIVEIDNFVEQCDNLSNPNEWRGHVIRLYRDGTPCDDIYLTTTMILTLIKFITGKTTKLRVTRSITHM